MSIQYLTVNGVAWSNAHANDSGYVLTKQSIVDAERNANYDLIGEFGKYKTLIDVTYPVLTGTELRAMVASTAQFFRLPVTYWNYYTAVYETGYFYPTEWAAVPMTGDEYPNDIYKDVKIQLIEH